MNRRWILPLGLLLSAPSPHPEDGKPPMMRGAIPTDPEPAVATLVVGANEVVGSVAEPGWPIIVSAALGPDEETDVKIPSNLRVKVTDEEGEQVALPFEPVPQSEENGEEEDLYWVASETATRSLAPGLYNITLAPETGVLNGFRVESGDLYVEEAGLERGSDSLGLLRTHRALLLGRDDDALIEAERLIAADTRNEDAWIVKGDILMMQGKPDDALKAYDTALALAKETNGEPLFIMERRRAAFSRSLELHGVIPPDQPE